MFIRIIDRFFKRYYRFTSGCENRPVSIPAVLPILSVASSKKLNGGKRPNFDLEKESRLHRWFLAWAILTGRMDALDWGNPETGPSIGAAAVMLPGVFDLPKVIRDDPDSEPSEKIERSSKVAEIGLPQDIVAKATSAMRKVRVLDAKGEPLSAAMMREMSLWIESDKWKVVMSPYTFAAYEAASEVVKVNFYRPTFQGDAAGCESPEPHRDTKFASIREDLFFPRDQVWLADENFYIAGKIVNLEVKDNVL